MLSFLFLVLPADGLFVGGTSNVLLFSVCAALCSTRNKGVACCLLLLDKLFTLQYIYSSFATVLCTFISNVSSIITHFLLAPSFKLYAIKGYACASIIIAVLVRALL